MTNPPEEDVKDPLDDDIFGIPEPMEPDTDLSDKVVFRIQTDALQDDIGRWLVDHASGDYREATDADVTFVDAEGWFEGSGLSMKAKPDADYNLFWQVNPAGSYEVDTGLDARTAKLAIWIYVEDVDAFYKSGWTEVDIGSGSWFGNEWARWQLTDEWINPGWNYLEFKLSEADENTGVDLSRLRWFRFCFVGAKEGDEFRIGDIKLISEIPTGEPVGGEEPSGGDTDDTQNGRPAEAPDPLMPDTDLSGKTVFRIQTDTTQDEVGRWLVDYASGDYREATDESVCFVDSLGWFDGLSLSMLARPDADYNLLWQVDPEGAYAVDTELDPATTKLAIWIYVENVEDFYASEWTEVDIGSGSWFGEEWAVWQLKDEWINKGWNYLEFKLSNADENTGVDLSRLRWFRFCFVGAEEGTEFRIGDIKLISDRTDDGGQDDPSTPNVPDENLTGKVVFSIQTDRIRDESGRWLVDHAVGNYQEATDRDVSFVDSMGWFDGSALSMRAKPKADYNLFWQIDPAGKYIVDTGLDPATTTLTMWLYVEDVDAFYRSSWTEVDIGSGGWFGEEWACWQLKDEQIRKGWNYLEFKLSEADENTGVDLSRLRWFRFCFVGAKEGTEFRIGDIKLISEIPAGGQTPPEEEPITPPVDPPQDDPNEGTTAPPVDPPQDDPDEGTIAPPEQPPQEEPKVPQEDLSDKAVFQIQTNALKDEYGRWLVDHAVGDYREATGAEVSFVDSAGLFEGTGLAMKAKPNADYNLFWQVDPAGTYTVDTGLDPATAKLAMWIYVEDAEAFYRSSWTEVDIGSGGWFGEEWAVWQLKDEQIREGWNYLEFKLSEADENTGVDLSRLRWFRFCFVGAQEGAEFRIGDIKLISEIPAGGQTPSEEQPEDPPREQPPQDEPVTPNEDLSNKTVFRIQTNELNDEFGCWLVDYAVGDYRIATGADVSFVDSGGLFEGTGLAMKAKPNADYNLFWQADPAGAYAVDTGLDPATTKLTIWIYVEDVEAFYRSGWTEIDIGSGGWFGEEWAVWQLKDEQICEGWNYLEFKLSEADENTGVDLSRLRWFRFCFVGAEEGTEFRIGDIKLISDVLPEG